MTPDPSATRGLYERINALERASAEHGAYWKNQEALNEKREEQIDGLLESVVALRTTIYVATGIIGFLVALAGVVVPLVTR